MKVASTCCRLIPCLVLASEIACSGSTATSNPNSPSSSSAVPPAFTVLVFSKTEGFRHDSIPAGIAAVRALGSQFGYAVDATEDSAAFSNESLAKYKAVVFLSTTGDVLNEVQQAAFERFIRAGGGFVGVHSAADTEYDWPFYGELMGAYFNGHPDIQMATIHLETPHPSTSGLPANWMRRDEWYNFQRNPRAAVSVLATLDERTYSGGTMGADHPIVWAHEYAGGRAWYTAGGHTSESYAEGPFRDHLGKAIVWAATGR
jgi:type 1 glutamine amidotransferase